VVHREHDRSRQQADCQQNDQYRGRTFGTHGSAQYDTRARGRQTQCGACATAFSSLPISQASPRGPMDPPRCHLTSRCDQTTRMRRAVLALMTRAYRGVVLDAIGPSRVWCNRLPTPFTRSRCASRYR
jgi:hypothetical protein